MRAPRIGRRRRAQSFRLPRHAAPSPLHRRHLRHHLTPSVSPATVPAPLPFCSRHSRSLGHAIAGEGGGRAPRERSPRMHARRRPRVRVSRRGRDKTSSPRAAALPLSRATSVNQPSSRDLLQVPRLAAVCHRSAAAAKAWPWPASRHCCR